MMSQIIKLMSVLFLLVIAVVHVNCRKVKTPLFCLDPLFLLDSLFLLCFFFLSPLSVSTNHLIFCILSCCTSKKYYFSRSIPPLHLMAHAVLKNFLLHFFWKVSIAQSFFKSLFLQLEHSNLPLLLAPQSQKLHCFPVTAAFVVPIFFHIFKHPALVTYCFW